MSKPFSAYKDQNKLIEALEKIKTKFSEFIYSTVVVVFTFLYNAWSIPSFCVAKKYREVKNTTRRDSKGSAFACRCLIKFSLVF